MSTQLAVVEQATNQVMNLIPNDFTAKAFGGDKREMYFALAACMKNDNLQKCSPQSIADSIIRADATGLSFNPALKQADLIPRYSQKNGWQCEFQATYRGLQLLVEPEMTIVCSDVVRVGDKFEPVAKSGFPYLHVKSLPMPGENYDPKKIGQSGQKGQIYASYAIARRNGEEVWRLLDLHDLEAKIRQSSSSFDKTTNSVRPGSYRDQHPAEMHMKDAILALIHRYPIKSIALGLALANEYGDSEWQESDTQTTIASATIIDDDEAQQIRYKFQLWYDSPERTDAEREEVATWKAAGPGGRRTDEERKQFLAMKGVFLK